MPNREMLIMEDQNIRVIYPEYLEPEEKQALRDRFGQSRGYMWCGCSKDEKLFYRFSQDARIYPEHLDYVHEPGCMFASDGKADRKKEAYTRNLDTGEVTAYLNFRPYEFTPPHEEKRTSDGTGEEHAGRVKDGLCYLTLEHFIWQINTDTFNGRMSAGKGALSSDFFISALCARLKHVRIDGLSKPLREFRLDTDNWQFFYTRFVGCDKKESGDGRTSYSIRVEGPEGKSYSWFIFSQTYEAAVKRFERAYGTTPENLEGYDIMMAGFRYNRKRRDSGVTYRVVGRICIFVTNRNGIYARTLTEAANFDVITDFLYRNRSRGMRYIIADEGEPYAGYFMYGTGTDRYLIVPKDTLDAENVLKADITQDKITADDLTGLTRRERLIYGR